MTSTLRSWLILAFCVLYLGTQAFFIVRGYYVDDKRFAFWMFSESTRYTATLYRKTADGSVVKADKGGWAWKTDTGTTEYYHWGMFVMDFRLQEMEEKKRAKTSWHITKTYLQHALDYVIDNIPNDPDTVQLILEIDYQVAGAETKHLTLTSHERKLP